MAGEIEGEDAKHVDVPVRGRCDPPSHRPLRGGRAALPARLNYPEKVLDPEHPDLAATRSNLAILFEDTGAAAAASGLVSL